MKPLAEISSKAAAALSLLVWFGPFVPLLFIFARELAVAGVFHGITILPFVAGISPAFVALKMTGQTHSP